MTDPWNAPGQQPPAPPGGEGQPPAGYGQQPYAQPMYGQPPEGYQAGYQAAYPQPGYGGMPGPIGRVRPTGKCILLTVVTLGIYVYVYNYQVHDEMKRHSGRGIGGGIALLLTFIASVAMPFVTPAEVGSLYALRGQRPPVRGWTGLWVILPAVGGYIVFFITLFAGAGVSSSNDPYGSTTTSDTAFGVAAVLGLVLFLGAAIAGGIIWFVKTNGALNRYWESFRQP